jgi:hypothetical protein
VAGYLGRTAAERVNARENELVHSTTNRDLRTIVSSQDTQGVTQEQMDIDFLKNLEAYTRERSKVKAKEYLASIGKANTLIEMSSEATYVQSGPVKLAVIRLKSTGARSTFIMGIVGREFKRVLCQWESEEAIPITYGVCADKIAEVFGVRIGS